ncbi:EAL domain-containing protein [Sulfurimonas lithotrophica]|uniref:EAL domain-containing protein n=1 Tax=Sulfurimonas lithotrophica TaxID=2590022 RepID=A0A5P8NYS4_9BACT|nr:EAL domain-containing protein [Sulfurimonas lithotrophica]QFR48578.1 EAL domain-containing protein [Sulfurimonas lithotrophica]
MVKKKEFFLFLLLIFLSIFFIYIYVYIKQAQNDIFYRIEDNKIKNVGYVLQNIEKDIINNNAIKTEADLVNLLSDKKTREDYEQKISLFLTPNLKYIYLLYKDERNRFRFLLDASKEDKADFYQKFDVFNEKYNLLYKQSKPQVIRQSNMQNLYLTYLYPIKSSGKVIGILSVDITTKIQQTILQLVKPIETFFVILIIFTFLLLLMTAMQIFHYFITRKKIFTDPLTQTFNRNYLQEISPNLNLNHYSIAMLDLDRFKLINDTYGHKAGDFILSQTTMIIKSSIRDIDILIRYGGEEFLLLIHNRYSNNISSDICERIRENIHSHIFSYENNKIDMQISIGVYDNPAKEKNLNEAIKIADKMLYIAKKEGRNRIINYNETSDSTILSKSIDIEFVKQALYDNRVICFYQPIYDHNSKNIIKYEALVRIIDKNDEIIPPIYFLPGLKHTNIHYKLTQRILSVVFDKFKDSKESVSININFSDLINEDIENTITETFTANPNLASRVTFEILESDDIENIVLFKEKINLLHSFNAKVSIDDFGSGYSNFKTILDIEANFLKIDGSLVKNIDKNRKDFRVVKSIVHFAKEANMQTIAEFVHSKEVYEKLKELGVDYMQGYYIAQPSEKLITKEALFSKSVKDSI